MKKYITIRLLALPPILLGISIICFAFMYLVPGSIVDLMAGGEVLSPEMEAKLKSDLGLDKPIYVQWALWLFRVMQGDFGKSLATGLPVLDTIVDRLPVNIELLIIASLFMTVFGIVLGAISAAKENKAADYFIRVLAILGYCIPNFWLATIMILIGSLYIPSLPVLNYVPYSVDPVKNIVQLIIPGFVIALASLAFVVRMTRSSFLENMRQDYVRTARAKGLTEKLVFFRHITKNSLIPVVTVLGIQISHLIGSFVLTEEIFVLPGVGRLLLKSILARDFPIITGVILMITVIVVIANLIVDVLYSYLDPRIKY